MIGLLFLRIWAGTPAYVLKYFSTRVQRAAARSRPKPAYSSEDQGGGGFPQVDMRSWCARIALSKSLLFDEATRRAAMLR